MTENTTPRAKVYDILAGFSTAMFVTHGPGGRPAARPMHVARVEDGAGDIWFLTSKGGTLLDEVQGQPVVLLVFQNDNSAYLSVRGRARVVDDGARIDAEYWDTRGVNKLEYLFEAAKAYVKGEKPAVGDPDQHAKTLL